MKANAAYCVESLRNDILSKITSSIQYSILRGTAFHPARKNVQNVELRNYQIGWTYCTRGLLTVQ